MESVIAQLFQEIWPDTTEERVVSDEDRTDHEGNGEVEQTNPKCHSNP